MSLQPRQPATIENREPTAPVLRIARKTVLERLTSPNPQTGLSYVRNAINIRHEGQDYRINTHPLLEEYGATIHAARTIERRGDVGGVYVVVALERMAALRFELARAREGW